MNLNIQNEDNSSNHSNHSHRQTGITKINQKAAELIGGPYLVELGKPYKPIFICFIDLNFAITFIIGSTLFFWNRLDISMKTED